MLENNWLMVFAAQEARVTLGYHQIPQQSASISNDEFFITCGKSWNDDLDMSS